MDPSNHCKSELKKVLDQNYFLLELLQLKIPLSMRFILHAIIIAPKEELQVRSKFDRNLLRWGNLPVAGCSLTVWASPFKKPSKFSVLTQVHCVNTSESGRRSAFGSAKARVGLRRLPSGPLGAEQLSGGMEKMLLMMMMMTTIWLFGSSSVCPRLFLHCLPLLGLRTFHRGIFRSGTLGKSTDHRAQSPRCGDALACHSYHMGWPREFIGAGTLWFLVAVRISTVVAVRVWGI